MDDAPIEVAPESPHLPATPMVAPDVVPLETIKKDVEALSSSDKLDKESALQMTRLFHSMELLLSQETNTRDARIAALQHEIQEQRLRVELDRLITRQIQEESMTPRGSVKRR